jgi:hypothetical protein
MSNPNLRWCIAGATLVIILPIVTVKLLPIQKPKPATPLTAQQVAKNECAQRELTLYTKDKLALSQSQGSPLHWSVENIIAQRRLEEQFCIRFVQCAKTASAMTESLSNGIDAVNFDNCLRDEAMDDYDAIPRDEMDEEKTDSPRNDD